MLDKVVSLELIVPTLEKQIRPYMKAHNLKEDHVFSKYVIVRIYIFALIACFPMCVVHMSFSYLFYNAQ